MMAFISIPIILLLVISRLDKEHNFLKILLMFFVFDGVFLIGAYISDPTSTNIYLTFYKHTIAILTTFVLYVFVFFIYKTFQYFEKLPKIKGWKK